VPEKQRERGKDQRYGRKTSKIDERRLQSFKISAEKVRNDLEGAIINMYAHLHLFQNVIIIDQNNQIHEKLTQYGIIREGITNISKWIEKIQMHHLSYIDNQRWKGR
jgi:hypothetical protein